MTTQGDEVPTRTSSVADGAGPKDEAPGAEPEASPPRAAGRRRFRYTLPGAWVALVFACLAFTPSLLPRTALLQGVVCGITAAIGYGVGVAGAWTWRAFADRDPRPPRPGAWRVFAISAVVALAVALGPRPGLVIGAGAIGRRLVPLGGHRHLTYLAARQPGSQ